MRQISVKIASTLFHFQDTVSTDANSEPYETYKILNIAILKINQDFIFHLVKCIRLFNSRFFCKR